MITSFLSLLSELSGPLEFYTSLWCVLFQENGRGECESQAVRLCLVGMTIMRNVRRRKTAASSVGCKRVEKFSLAVSFYT